MPDAQHFDAPIPFFNRATGEVETEDIYGEGFMR